MRKKDPSINENIDNPGQDDQNHPGASDQDASQKDPKGLLTQVKNASASGLGAMGRSDEKLNDQSGQEGSDIY